MFSTQQTSFVLRTKTEDETVVTVVTVTVVTILTVTGATVVTMVVTVGDVAVTVDSGDSDEW
jgi:hypothetical protein